MPVISSSGASRGFVEVAPRAAAPLPALHAAGAGAL